MADWTEHSYVNTTLQSRRSCDEDIEFPNTSTQEIFVAPADDLWYHGRLERHVAEERLQQARKSGSYLVRESDRKPGSYVLSFLGKSGINHFRITAVCGDYYIGGRRFDSLASLIGNYTNVTDLLKTERLAFPVAPPQPVNDKKRVVAVLPYTKMPDTDELTFQRGDIFFVHNDMGEGWLWVTAHRTGEQGLIFRDLVQELDDSIDPNTVFKWFHTGTTKEEAVDLLIKAGPGSFLVRPSDNSPGDYSLFFHINNQIQRFRIEKRGVRYIVGGRTFECLDAVINRYRKEQIIDGHALTIPVCRPNKDEVDGNVYSTKELQRAEKIYISLQECREQVGLKKMKGIKMQSYLRKRSEKSKKWKALYFVLLVGDGFPGSASGGSSDVHLCFYDNPKRTKPKGLIDLSCAYVYQVDESLFEKKYCFQIVERALPCLANITYLSANSSDVLQQWLNALRPHCISQLSPRYMKANTIRGLRYLQLHIVDAHRLPFKLAPSPYFIVSLNQVKVAMTKVKSNDEQLWDEEFFFDDIPTDVASFTISLYNKEKRQKGKESELAEVTVDFNSLGNGEQREEWFSLLGITPIGEWGSLRLRTRFLNDLIMPTEEYSPLQQLILESELEVVKALADICHLDRIPLATTLFRIFKYENKEAKLCVSLTEMEIQKESETSTLFRGASLTTAVLDLFMRSVCEKFVHSALGDLIARLSESKISCELNPNKMDPSDDACTNAEFLLQVLDDVTHAIFMSAESCSKTLRYVCNRLQKAAVSKWPHERLVRTRVVSGFIFLRLLCPAILNPKKFSLVNEMPPPNVSRSLVMVAKCLQNLANLVEFGGKEPHMEVVNPFILKNKERMVVFLDQLSSVPDCPSPTADERVKDEKTRRDTARELATLHHFCMAHLEELHNLSTGCASLKKLVTVTEMLEKHKQKYLEKMAC